MEKFFTSFSQQGLSADGCLHTSAQLSLFRFDNPEELPFRALSNRTDVHVFTLMHLKILRL